MTAERLSFAPRRAAALAVDGAIIALWTLLACLVARRFTGTALAPWQAEAWGFLLVTLPALAYFVLFEAGARQATPGKRLAGLIVSGPDGHPPPRRIVLRNLVKLAPLELGNLVAAHALFAPVFPYWVYVPLDVGIVLVGWWAFTAWGNTTTPYELISRTCVLRRDADVPDGAGHPAT